MGTSAVWRRLIRPAGTDASRWRFNVESVLVILVQLPGNLLLKRNSSPVSPKSEYLNNKFPPKDHQAFSNNLSLNRRETRGPTRDPTSVSQIRQTLPYSTHGRGRYPSPLLVPNPRRKPTPLPRRVEGTGKRRQQKTPLESTVYINTQYDRKMNKPANNIRTVIRSDSLSPVLVRSTSNIQSNKQE